MGVHRQRGYQHTPARDNKTHRRILKGWLTPFERKFCIGVVCFGMNPVRAWRYAGGRCVPIRYADGRVMNKWKAHAGMMFWRLSRNGAYERMGKELKDLVPSAVSTLEDLLLNGKNENAKLGAAKTVLDRTGYGTSSTVKHEGMGTDLASHEARLIELFGAEKAGALLKQIGLEVPKVLPIKFTEVKPKQKELEHEPR